MLSVKKIWSFYYIIPAIVLITPLTEGRAQFWQGGTGTQAWNSSANWSDGTVPGASDGTKDNFDVAFFQSNQGPTSITIDPNRNLGTLIFFDEAGAFTIGSAGVNQGNALHLSSGGIFSIAAKTVVATPVPRSITINAPLVIEPVNQFSAGAYSFENFATASDTDSNPYKLIINGNIQGGTTTSNIELTFNSSAGSRTNTNSANEVNGLISNGGAQQGVSVKIQGANGGNQGVWRFTNNNSSYTGNTSVTAATLLFTSIADVGVNSSLGAGSSFSFSGGAIARYVGSGNTTNRTINAAGQFYNDGTGALTLNGAVSTGLIFRGSQSFIINGLVSGSSGLSRTDSGTVFLNNNNNNFTGDVSISDGAFRVTSVSDNGTASAIGLNGRILLGQNSGTIGRFEYAGASTSTNRIILMRNDSPAPGGSTVTGRGKIDVTTTGQTLTLTGPVRVNNATNYSDLELMGVGNGLITGVIGGTIATPAAIVSLKIVKSGSGTWTLSGANTYARETVVNGGILNLQNSSALGATISNETTPTSTGAGTTVSNGATLQLQNNISIGAEALILNGTGAAGQTGALVNVSGTNSFDGALTLASNTTISSDSGSLNLTNTAAIVGSGGSRTLTLAGAGNGSLASNMNTAVASLTKNGSGIWTLSGANTYTGATTVNAGTLNVTGTLGNTAVSIKNGATLAGSGTFAGAVTVDNFGSISVGNALSAGSTGTLGFNALTLNNNTQLFFDLGTVSDKITVANGITLDGIVNIAAGSGFGAGTYDLITYGTLTADNLLQLGSLASGYNYTLDTLTAGTVKIVVDQTNLSFWDGNNLTPNGTVDGGNGTWNNDLTNWTNGSGTLNDPWNSQTAVFAGTSGGTVQIAETVSVAGIQFAKNYTLSDIGGGVGRISINGTSSEIRVDPAVTATISTEIIGSGGINKTNTGTLILSGANSYAGTTRISQGTLKIGATNTLPTTGAVIVGSGDFLTGNLDVTDYSQQIGSLQLDSNNTTIANTVTVGSGQTLTISGTSGFKLGSANTVPNSTRTSLATFTGGGTLDVNNTSANFEIGIASSVVDSTPAQTNNTLDLSSLGSFKTNISQLRVGFGLYNTGKLTLSNTSNQITATTLQIANSNGLNAGSLSTMTLGAGTNEIKADTINIGLSKGLGAISFASQTIGSPGSVVINGKSSSAANITIGSTNSTGTASTPEGLLDLRGHSSTVVSNNLIMAQRNSSGGGGAKGTLRFDTGTFTVNSLDLGSISVDATGTAEGLLSIGGGTFTVNNSFTMGTFANTTITGKVISNVSITGGSLVSNAAIVEVGGTNSNTTNTVTTITLDGGTLDMTGHNIGSATNAIDTLTLASGTLKDTGEINGGAAIAKTTIGTLIMAGNNAYSGTTTVSAGTMLANNDYMGTSSATGTGAVTVNAGTTFGGTGRVAGNVNLASGATLAPGGNAVSIAAAVAGLNTDVGTLKFQGSLVANGGSAMALQLKTNGVHNLSPTYGANGLLSSVSGISGDGGNDRIIISGNFTLDATSSISLTFGTGYNPMGRDVFDLLDWTTLDGTASDNNKIALSYYGDATGKRFGGTSETYALKLPDLSVLGSGWFWDVSQFGNLGVIAIVPEPSRVLLIYAGILMFTLRRRRKAVH